VPEPSSKSLKSTFIEIPESVLVKVKKIPGPALSISRISNEIAPRARSEVKL